MPLSPAEIIRGAFRLYGHVLAASAVIALVAHLPMLLLADLITGSAPPEALPSLGVLLLALALTAVAVGAISGAMLAALVGRAVGAGRAVGWALRRGPVSVLVVYLLTSVVAHLGLLLFVLPGLVLGGLFATAVPVVLVEGLRPIPALARAWTLARREPLKAIGVFAFALFFSELLPLQLMLGLMALAGPSPYSPLLGYLLSAVSLPLALAANLLLYVSLRAGEAAGEPAALRAAIKGLLPEE